MPTHRQTNPAAAAAALAEAMQAHQQGDLDTADSLYATTLEYDPDNAQALRLKGIIARELGDPDNSLRLLEKAHRLAPDTPAPLNELALSHMVAGNLPAAERALRQTLQIVPADVTALTNLGALLQHRGHINSAIECYTALLDQHPDDVEVRCNLAKALVDSGQTEAALGACDLVIELTESHPYTLAVKGAVLADLERYSEALPLLSMANQRMPGDDMALVNQALCQDTLGDTAAAERTLQQAIDINPLNARAVADLANCLTKLAQADKAMQLCEDFLQDYPAECLVIGSYALALAAAGETERANALTDCASLFKVFTLNLADSDIDLRAFNSKLAEQLNTDPSLLNDPISKSTRGGAQTGELDFDSSPELHRLQDFFAESIRAVGKAYEAAGLQHHPVLAGAAAEWSLRGWGTVLQTGGKQSAHMHPLGWLSGVYYVQIPDAMRAGDDHAGALLLGPTPPRFKQAQVQRVYHRPIAGQLVLFPSWFWHQTVPFSGPASRFSIAFDVLPKNALRML